MCFLFIFDPGDVIEIVTTSCAICTDKEKIKYEILVRKLQDAIKENGALTMTVMKQMINMFSGDN